MKDWKKKKEQLDRYEAIREKLDAKIKFKKQYSKGFWYSEWDE